MSWSKMESDQTKPSLIEPCIILEALKVLVSPADPKQISKVAPDGEARLDFMIQLNCKKLRSLVQSNSKFHDICPLLELDESSDPRLHFVELNLRLLRTLCHSLTAAAAAMQSHTSTDIKQDAPPLPADAISLSAHKVVMASIRFVIGLGVHPALCPGVGPKSNVGGGRVFGNALMAACVRVLAQCIELTSVGADVVTHHLGDLLAALCQLVFGPAEARDAELEFWCKRQLDAVLQLRQPLVMKELLVLQGPPAKQCAAKGLHPAPAWLRDACGRMLAERLMLPGGLRHLLAAMLPCPRGDEFDWKRCDALAEVIAGCLRRNTTPRVYCKAVGPQILELLHIDDKSTLRQYLRVAVSIIAAMEKKYPEAVNTYILHPLLSPLQCCLQPTSCFFGDKDSVVVSEEDLCHCIEDVHQVGLGDKDSVVVSEEDLCHCIEDVHQVFVAGTGPGNPLISHLKPFSHALFQLYCATKHGISHLSILVEQILVKFLKFQETPSALSHLRVMAFGVVSSDDCKVNVMDKNITFGPTTGGALAVIRRPSSDGTSLQLESCELKATLIAGILQKVQCDTITAEFVLFLLKELTSIISEETAADKCSVRFLPAPVDAMCEAEKLNHNLQVLTLLAQMCEVHGHKCFRSNDHVLQFVMVTLERGVQVLEKTNDENFGVFENETLTMAMGLLTAILSQTKEMTSSDRARSKELLPLLKHLADCHPNPELQEMATDLRIAIATHNVIPSEFASEFARNFQKKVSAGSKTVKKRPAATDQVAKGTGFKSSAERVTVKPIIEVLSSTNFDDAVTVQDVSELSQSRITEMRGNEETSNRESVNVAGDLNDVEHCAELNEDVGDKQDNISFCETIPSENLLKGMERVDLQGASLQNGNRSDGSLDRTSAHNCSTLSQAFAELYDPLIPVRGHALLTLRRLVETGDTEALARRDTLLEVFRENLAHPDSYLHLAAIGGLAALGERSPRQVLPVILREITACRQESGRSAEHRLKLGEVMVRVSRALGETIPQYREELLSAFLAGVCDKEPLVRASSLSNLAEICSLLHFSLGSVLHEIFECVSCSLKTDRDAEVRKAAVAFINLLLRGTAADTLQVLEPVLRDLYHLLKHAVTSDSEEMVRVHAQLALEELDSFMRKFLFPMQTLSKKITVLHP